MEGRDNPGAYSRAGSEDARKQQPQTQDPTATDERPDATARPSPHAEDQSPAARDRTGEGGGGVKKRKKSLKSCRHDAENGQDLDGRRETR